MTRVAERVRKLAKPTMAELLQEEVEHLHQNTGNAAGFIDDPDFERLEEDGADAAVLEAAGYAYGYLKGAADALGLTIRELLDEHGLELPDEEEGS